MLTAIHLMWYLSLSSHTSHVILNAPVANHYTLQVQSLHGHGRFNKDVSDPSYATEKLDNCES